MKKRKENNAVKEIDLETGVVLLDSSRKNNKNATNSKKNKDSINVDMVERKAKKKRNAKRDRPPFKQFGKWLIYHRKKFLVGFSSIILAGVMAVILFVAVLIAGAERVEPSNIYSLLSETSTLYDDAGQPLLNIYANQNRENVEIADIPMTMQNAIIAIEDKTFYEHDGFNYIRLVGAVIDAFLTQGEIGGTSTLSQQLARNIYLEDTRFDRSISRKIIEAYYTIQIENTLTKDQILEAYLNTVFYGYNSYGIQIASQSYFSKDVTELTLVEAATLASLPQIPSTYALVQEVSTSSITEEDTNILYQTNTSTFLYNESAMSRRDLCLSEMKAQGYITQEEYDEAVVQELTDYLNPTYNTQGNHATYFADYVTEEVATDLMAELDLTYGEAVSLVHSGGYQIHTTLDSVAQTVVEAEYADPSNFMDVSSLRKDSNNNIIDESGNLVLNDYYNYFDSNGVFTFRTDEITVNEDGSLTIMKGKRLNIYDTVVDGNPDYSVEFKEMYTVDNDILFSIQGGYINIPQTYKSRDDDYNLLIDSSFLTDYPDFLVINDDGTVSVPATSYTLADKTRQPQSAMVIVENETGQIKAMIGGRDTFGRYLFNRAIETNNPGSSFKPLAGYAPALQLSHESASAGSESLAFRSDVGDQGASLYGDFLTAGSTIDDEPLYIAGREWPKNFSGTYSGFNTMRTAIDQSVNTCAVKVLAQVGIEYGYEMAQKFGITTLVEEDKTYSLVLGGLTYGASPLEMAIAYTTFPNYGYNYEASSYTQVLNKEGEVILSNEPVKRDVLDPGVAYIMADMLKDVPAWSLSGVTAGGKTGTTDYVHDLWFVGFTPTYSAAVWQGADHNLPQTGSSTPFSYLWRDIMNQIPRAVSGSYKATPSNVITATVQTSKGAISELFTSGTQPSADSQNSFLQEAIVCADTGLLATPNCANTKEMEGILLQDETDPRNTIPRYYCNHHNPDTALYPIPPGTSLVHYVYVTLHPGEGGGSAYAVSTLKDGTYTLPDPGFTAPEGKAFNGWNTPAGILQPGETVTITDATTITATWVDKDQYTVSFDPAGGTGSMSSVSVYDGDSYTLPASTLTPPPDKVFGGWLINGTPHAVGSSYVVTGHVLVTATWIDAEADPSDP